MTLNSIQESQRTAAKVAGLTCLLATVLVMFSQLYLLAGLIVPGNAPETARNFLSHETLVRFTVACNLVYVAGTVALLCALYLILEPVNRGLALVAAVCRLIFALMWLGSALNMLAALRLFHGAPYLNVLPTDQLQALGRLHIPGNFDAYYVGLPFFALASTICSYLWLKSRYIPRALAGFGLIASAWCVFCAFAFIVFPNFNDVVNDWWFDTPMAVFELVLSVWLLLKGLRPDIDGNNAAAG